MKKNIIRLLFLMLFSVFIANGVTAQASGKTGGEIGFIDGTKPTLKQPKPTTSKELAKKSSGLLPKTGEEFLMYLTIIGLFSLTVTGVVMVKRKK